MNRRCRARVPQQRRRRPPSHCRVRLITPLADSGGEGVTRLPCLPLATCWRRSRRSRRECHALARGARKTGVERVTVQEGECCGIVRLPWRWHGTRRKRLRSATPRASGSAQAELLVISGIEPDPTREWERLVARSASLLSSPCVHVRVGAPRHMAARSASEAVRLRASGSTRTSCSSASMRLRAPPREWQLRAGSSAQWLSRTCADARVEAPSLYW